MPFPRIVQAASGAIVTLALGATAASAATAYASTTVNVRSGAGTGYSVVDVLEPGDEVDVNYCKGVWCFVDKPGPNGWVNANFLTQDYYADDSDDYYDEDDEEEFYIVRPQRPQVRVWPRYRSQVCVNGQNASFCLSD